VERAVYREHGFRDLQPREVDAGHAGDREKEAQHGLRVEARVSCASS
jgi:hypothetical protein